MISHLRSQWAATVYLGWSILGLVLAATTDGFFGWAQHPTVTMWLGKLFQPLMLTSLYGIMAGLLILLSVRSLGGTVGWTIPAFLLGGLTILVSRGLLMLGHIDCGDNCVPGVTPYWLIDVTTWWLTLATLAPPTLVVVKAALDRRTRMADASMTPTAA